MNIKFKEIFNTLLLEAFIHFNNTRIFYLRKIIY